MKTAQNEARQQFLADAADAGRMIRFFLDGGNDSKLQTAEDGALMTFSKIGHLVKEAGAYNELIDAAGFCWKRDAMGGWTLAKK